MITAKRRGTLSIELKAGNHTLVSDVSPKLGGADEGPNPHELVEAGLAACTSMTMQMYANRKGWDLKSANVTVRIVSEGREGSKISREIAMEGELTSEQRERLFEIANKCPVHILLESAITVESKLVS